MRVVIAEDSVLLREGLTRLLTDRGHDVVAGVGDGDALVKTVAELADAGRAPGCGRRGRTDAADPHRRGRTGGRSRCAQAHADLGVLVLSQYVEEQYATELLAGSSRGRRLSAQGPRRRGT